MVCVRAMWLSLARCWVTTLARSSCSRTRTIAMKSQSPVTVYTSATPSTSASSGPRWVRPSRSALTRMNAVSMESRRDHRNHPAGCLAVSPHVHVAVFETVGAEDRADMGPVVVAVVQRLEEHHAKVQLELSVAVLR